MSAEGDWHRPRCLSPLLAVACVVFAGCSGAGSGGAPAPATAGAHPDARSVAGTFRDVAAEAGLDFVHFNGRSGELYLCEMMGPGGALFDYDADGDLDVYIVQGEMLGPGKTPADAIAPPGDRPVELGDRLYRNELVPGAGPRFTDVSEPSGIRRIARGYGMGVAAGDVDNDGRVDLYVTRFGENQLLRNQGDGTFRDVTRESGTTEPRWSVSASFLDVDGDGWLDLYVGNYLDFGFHNHQKCADVREDYCAPDRYNPLTDRLFRNRGDGTFEDVSVASRIAGAAGSTLGVVAADFDDDGRLDVYVANDGLPNFLWHNRGDGTFEDVALLGGSALSENGEAEAGMGVDAADLDDDGEYDLILAHLATETHTLYLNEGGARFRDATIRAGLAAPTLAMTGFGAGFVDLDEDGRLDIVSLNGAVTVIEALALAGDPFPLHQPNQAFRNLGDGRFEDWTERAGAVFALSEVSRGGAWGDLDNDGDADLLVLNNEGPARLLLNVGAPSGQWLGLELVGPPGRERPMLGAEVWLDLDDGRRLRRRAHADGSYASSSDPRLLINLGEARPVGSLRIRWPGGREQSLPLPELDRWHRLHAPS